MSQTRRWSWALPAVLSLLPLRRTAVCCTPWTRSAGAMPISSLPLPLCAALAILAVSVSARESIECGDRGSPEHGTARVVLRRSAGVLMEYRCDTGYHRQGSLYSVCVQGVWTSALPVCTNIHSEPVNDGASRDPGVLRSLEELPTQQTMSKKDVKTRQMRKKKKRRKRKGKRKSMISMTAEGNDASASPNFDMSCLLSSSKGAPKFVRPPQVPNSVGPKFVRRKTEKQHYLVAIYRCIPGYKLHNPLSRSLGCQGGKWIGRLPICLPRRSKTGCMNAGCEHDCREVDGKPKCFCFKGFYQKGRSCIDINECSKENGGCERTCHNTPGSFFCGCQSGYRLANDHSSCVDINECLARNGHGPCQGGCENVEGSYYCSCEGVPGTQLADDGISCADIDECSSADSRYQLGCSHSCINTLGTAFCTCHRGYQLATDWRTCQDIDECAANISGCSHGCENTPGSFSCSCPAGFTSSEDGNSCIDVDECMEFVDRFLCSHTCENNIGSYKCLCPTDYELSTDHRTCHPKEDDCQKKNCSQDCVIENNEAVCICDEGYTLEDDLTCVDVDECKEEIAKCSHDCVNEEGSFYCACPRDMFLSADKKSCRGNECNSSDCLDGCFNNNSNCSCPPGYETIGVHCEDIDECETSNHSCSQLCRNTRGSFQCYCREGFYLTEDKITCEDVDECEQENICSDKVCINTEGGYFCKCPSGYIEVNGTQECEDIDECSFIVDEGSKICSHYCVNSPGSFHCDCPLGFVLASDLITCEDIDECFENNEINMRCSHDCVNVLGSYDCECPQGYVLNEDKHSCSIEHGCQVNNGGCSHICIDDGDYPICECPEDLTLSNDSITCLQPKSSETNGGCNVSTGNHSCLSGFTFIEDFKQCMDVNECLDNNGNCSQQCLNTDGSYYCSCDPGYQIDSTTKECNDIDECSANTSFCNQICVNSKGSYKCECFNGFVLAEDGITCLDVNECLERVKCSQICLNTRGSFKCDCEQGYRLASDLVSCEDFDECSLNNSKCDQLCFNSKGGYSCGCFSGFNLMNETHCAEEINSILDQGECEYGFDFVEEKEKCCCKTGYILINNSACVLVKDCNIENGCNFTSAEDGCLPQGIKSSRTTTVDEQVRKGCEAFSDAKSRVKIDCGTVAELYPEGTECHLSCGVGYKLEGTDVRTCLHNGSWTGELSQCKAQVRPYIRCHPAIRLNLPHGTDNMIVKIPQPKSNMDWDKYVTSNPPWGKQLQASLFFGTTVVQFTATSPSSSHIAKCNISIYVKDAEKPTINPCPDDIKMYLRPNEVAAKVMWEESVITDNVRVAQVFQSQKPGVVLNKGLHVVNYIAVDSSGNIATCQFTITVTGTND